MFERCPICKERIPHDKCFGNLPAVSKVPAAGPGSRNSQAKIDQDAADKKKIDGTGKPGTGSENISHGNN
jgi:hypothetical protein